MLGEWEHPLRVRLVALEHQIKATLAVMVLALQAVLLAVVAVQGHRVETSAAATVVLVVLVMTFQHLSAVPHSSRVAVAEVEHATPPLVEELVAQVVHPLVVLEVLRPELSTVRLLLRILVAVAVAVPTTEAQRVAVVVLVARESFMSDGRSRIGKRYGTFRTSK